MISKKKRNILRRYHSERSDNQYMEEEMDTIRHE